MYYSPSSKIKRTIVEKTTKTKKAGSPTRRLIQMKNSSLKHKQNAANVRGSYNKMLYTLDPKNAYLVENEYPVGSTSKQIIKKTKDNIQGAVEEHVDDNGNLTWKYLFSAPHAQKVKKGGILEDVERTYEIKPSQSVHLKQEFENGDNVHDSLKTQSSISRKDIINKMEARTKDLSDKILKDLNDRETGPIYFHKSDALHDVLRSSLGSSKQFQ